MVTLQEMEGTTITLHTGITGIQTDAHIVWFNGPEKAEKKILISQMFKGETVTEISERFKERLQLDRSSGALTIRNISRNHSGVYLLQVITEDLSSRTFRVSVYEIFRYVGGSSGQELIRAVGESVTFNTSVPVSGNIIYKGDTVGQVFNNVSDTNLREKFVNRLQWVSLTGLFTLSDLRTDDSGLYTVESVKDPKRKQEYQLEVYERVSAPQVMKTTSSSSELCSVLCSVRNSRGLNLSLYEDDVLLNHTSSSSSNITLNLLLEIKKSDNLRSKTFSCVSSNPVSNERTRINLTHYCSLKTDSLATEGQTEEVFYSVINHKKATQPNIPEPASEDVSEACPLTTVYDRVTFGRTSDGTENN
ncbi:SLAM family member isoform X3 [Silurus meridionalis]|nr:SLAM family member isoform X3 [Silurus meridionalis]